MGLFEAVIRALIYICVIALLFFLVLWVLGSLGVALPAMVVNILKIIFVLVCILILVRLFWPALSGFNLFPPRGP
jgi:amino acid transporter